MRGTGVLQGSKDEPILVRFIDEGRALPFAGKRRVIFDSLVSNFPHDVSAPKTFGAATEEIRNVVEQSQQTLNCALSVDLL
jgi:hypothetical protein